MARSYRVLFVSIVFASVFLATAASAADTPFDPCSLLTPAEIKAVVGKAVEKGTPKVHSNPMAGSDCTYAIEGFGSLNLLTKPLQRGETPERIKAQLSRMKMAATDLADVGAGAFATSPGFGMVQVHAFKAGRYALITLMVPGSDEKSVRPMAAKLMKTALTRIK